MPEPDAVCVKYGPGAVVAVDLYCPRFGCVNGEAIVPGSAYVVNDYGVRDLLPSRCSCGVLFRVRRIVDIEAEGAKVGGA